jgi:hypothetical protein
MRYDDRNYYGDSRVQAGMRGDWFKSLDHKKMIAEVELTDEDGNEVVHVLPLHFEVCPTCEGRGTHTNPSIDCGGLSSEDFEQDPDFREDYFNGRYDVQCYHCHGDRVVPEIDREKADPEVLKALDERLDAEAEFRSIQESERRMGA